MRVCTRDSFKNGPLTLRLSFLSVCTNTKLLFQLRLSNTQLVRPQKKPAELDFVLWMASSLKEIPNNCPFTRISTTKIYHPALVGPIPPKTKSSQTARFQRELPKYHARVQNVKKIS